MTSSRYFRIVAALGCALFLRTGITAELEILVYPPLAGSSSILPMCRADQAIECKATLIDAFAVIQNPLWQSLLGAEVSKVILRLTSGLHRIAEPISLHWGSGASKNIQLEIVGAGKASVISGAVAIENWQKAPVPDLPARVSAKVREKLWVADVANLNLPINVIPHARGYGLPVRPVLTELFVDNAVQPPAAWPNSGYAKLIRPAQTLTADKTTFAIDGRMVSDWADEPDLMVLGFWRWDWAAQSYLIASKEIDTNSLTLMGSGSPYGIKDGQRVRVENALAELESPGEWYLDRANAKLYFLPSLGFQGLGGELSIAEGLIQIDASENILIHKLVFEKTRGDAVRVKKSRNIKLDQVVIRLTGNWALVIDDSYRSGVMNSLIEDNGDGGILLSGGDRKTLQSAQNYVENSVLRRFSRSTKTNGFGVSIAGVGQRIIGNTISDSPHSAIFFKGNDHLILKNEIFDVVRNR